MSNIKTSVLGFPRIGEQRELKKSLEAYWKDEISLSELQTTAKTLRKRHWEYMKNAGISIIPSNDFSFYDQMLDMSCLLGNIPDRIEWNGNTVDWDTFFLVARGRTAKSANRPDTLASEMTKWFDTNYHYIVPEFNQNSSFKLASSKPFDEYQEAKALGITTRPVLIGPATYLALGKEINAASDFDRNSLFAQLLPVYIEVLKKFKSLGVTEVQIDEPILALDITAAQKSQIETAIKAFNKEVDINIALTSYFGEYKDNLDFVFSLPVNSIHIDAVRGTAETDTFINKFPANKTLSLGIVEGRNIWKNNFEASLATIKKAVAKVGEENLVVSSSCSLLHSPYSLRFEEKLDSEIKNWLSFAEEKCVEVATLAELASANPSAKATALLAENKSAQESRATSSKIHNPAVKERLKNVKPVDFNRISEFPIRQKAQQAAFNFPLFPTTTIGSFPQTADVRSNRRANKLGQLSDADYDKFLAEKTIESIRIQEELEIDVLVHGEFERNDMVEYFGEQLSGFAFTHNGWVQSYGSRCVKPPVIFGDVSRPNPMTVKWSKFAQDNTKLSMKGMLTGPVTILQWSFVRNDQPRRDTTFQIALAIRDEVVDLEKAGIKVIQIDEPAIREGLPLRRNEWASYLDWAVNSFKLATVAVEDTTQIHTHMCYSEFNDIIDSIAALDADVISIETSRSKMELLDAFVNYNYPLEIGPGVYDIHSPRIPTVEEMEALIQKAVKVLPVRNIWINPDCGLKTRAWEDVKPALANMVKAAQNLRKTVKATA